MRDAGIPGAIAAGLEHAHGLVDSRLDSTVQEAIGDATDSDIDDWRTNRSGDSNTGSQQLFGRAPLVGELCGVFADSACADVDSQAVLACQLLQVQQMRFFQTLEIVETIQEHSVETLFCCELDLLCRLPFHAAQ